MKRKLTIYIEDKLIKAAKYRALDLDIKSLSQYIESLIAKDEEKK